jgi:hypothetical protein
MRRLPILLPLLLPACDRAEPPAADPANLVAPAPSAPPLASPGEPEPAQTERADDAAAVLRRYYDLIEAGDYASAWRMRGRGDEGAEAFAKNFAAYERYRVTLGAPTRPVQAGGWEFVEVPIHITGKMKGGKGFGSTGSVTMRRAAGAAGSSPKRGWHIYTG